VKSIALVTYSGSHELSNDDLLAGHLRERGFHPHIVSWDAQVDWRQFDAVVLRSCWDYHTRVDEFLSWCAMLKQEQIAVWNPIDIILWNYKKTYLQDLANKGINTIPTLWVEKNSECSLADIITKQLFEKAVVKPTIGASAYEVFLTDKSNHREMQPRLNELLKKTDVMIQSFIKEVQTEGEVSLIFIGGKYSHAVVKMPKPDDFRSNYDGTAKLFQPSDTILQQAAQIIKTIPTSVLYTRIDGIIIDDTLTLMELELIEPYLFFDLFPDAARTFAETLETLL
jgi:glutathione synthase/RimK-type ligase-like ATP-grasp enzyme